MKGLTSKHKYILNGLFLILCGGVFMFLWNAPPETTHKLPRDENHLKYFSMDKKEAEKECETCHNPQGKAPLPQNHPPKYRCLFCHKKG
ncbi:MAG: hypothetical protein A2511_16350 [Deltaproteobacteria bacterium RIFOXYD12_FULL_50_9]|nr:MAG: hypothetical protein A2511_16350 [Deltaproteobacteria bacterium RIFOXYD12_FULL_50_9]